MKKQIWLVLLIVSSSIYAEERGLFNTNKSDFSSIEYFERNKKGECDSTCDLKEFNLNGGLSSSFEMEKTEIEKAILIEEIIDMNCQQAGYSKDHIGNVKKKREYFSQNGIKIVDTLTQWKTIKNTCYVPAPPPVLNNKKPQNSNQNVIVLSGQTFKMCQPAQIKYNSLDGNWGCVANFPAAQDGANITSTSGKVISVKPDGAEQIRLDAVCENGAWKPLRNGKTLCYGWMAGG